MNTVTCIDQQLQGKFQLCRQTGGQTQNNMSSDHSVLVHKMYIPAMLSKHVFN